MAWGFSSLSLLLAENLICRRAWLPALIAMTLASYGNDGSNIGYREGLNSREDPFSQAFEAGFDFLQDMQSKLLLLGAKWGQSDSMERIGEILESTLTEDGLPLSIFEISVPACTGRSTARTTY